MFRAFNLLHRILRKESITPGYNVRVKFFQGEVDVTNTLFSVNYFSFAPSSFSSASSAQITNASALVFATPNTSGTGSYTIKFYVEDTKYFLEISTTLTFNVSSVFTIKASTLVIALTNIPVTYANWLLNYYFKRVNTLPLNWYLEIHSSLPRQTLVTVNIGPLQDNELNVPYFNYVTDLDIDINTDLIIDNIKIYDAASGGNLWVAADNFSNSFLDKDYPLSIHNNTITFLLDDSDIDVTALIDNNPNSILHYKFDGTLHPYSDYYEIETNIDPTYTTLPFLFNNQSLILNSFSPRIQDFNLSNSFTIQFFINFYSSPLDRGLTFFEKQGVIKLEKTAGNFLTLAVNNSSIFNTYVLLLSNVWYHFYISKNSGTGVTLRVNSILNLTGSTSSSSINQNSNDFVINNSNNPALGYLSTFDISTGVVPYVTLTQPLAKYTYQWPYISNYVWRNLNLNQWRKYCET